MPAFPIAHVLVPDTPGSAASLGDEFTRVRVPLAAGLPQRIPLQADLHVVAVLPTGLARTWIDTSPTAVVTDSSDDLAPRADDESSASFGGRSPLRLVVQRGRTIVGSIALTVGHRQRCAPTATAPVEIQVVAWRLVVASLIGPGDHGSFIEFGWRHDNTSLDHFGPPPANPFVLKRKPPAEVTESQPGDTRVLQRYLRGESIQVLVRQHRRRLQTR